MRTWGIRTIPRSYAVRLEPVLVGAPSRLGGCWLVTCERPWLKSGHVMREQKHRSGKMDKSASSIFPEVLDVLRQFVEALPDLPDDAPLFRGERGRHRGSGLPGGLHSPRRH